MTSAGFVADLVLYVHFAIVVFLSAGEFVILAGGALRWRWVKNRIFRVSHLFLMGFVAFEAVAGIWCPLTILEYDLRVGAGQEKGENIPFVAGLVRRIIFYDFPSWVFTALYVAFFLLIVLTLHLVPLEKRRKKRA